jgi:hypothetical protein
MNHQIKWKVVHCAGLFLSLLLGAVFLLAAFSKIESLDDLRITLNGVPFLPQWARALVVLMLPGFELTLGFCLISRLWLREATLLANGLLVIFLIYGIFINVAPQMAGAGCGCFIRTPLTAWLEPRGWWLVGRDVCLVVLGLTCSFVAIYCPEASPSASEKQSC